ncbi:putative cuticle collagen 145 [Watersipora subatra]|uniref:putative cuticle collagen 145 n=1 Tax=Watersipora subatra TaxID=2589382 RepID=UPI00355B9EC2
MFVYLVGPPGPPGTAGRDGRDGEDGMPGRDGLDGNDGTDGSDGLDGLPGRDGRDGVDGSDGADGLPGRDGIPGRDGEKGDVGNSGEPGIEGRAGERGPKGESGQAAGGAIYTRWGRTTCGSNAVLLYEGFVGGSPFQHQGGGGNYQCMVNDAVYNRNNAVTISGYMAGTEYQTYSYGVFSNSANEQNVPCAVCYAETRSSVIMIPGKRSCPDNEWTIEYEGYIMSANYVDNGKTTFECVDANPEYIDGESANDNGALFHFNKASCSQGVPCPPYNANKAITCADCLVGPPGPPGVGGRDGRDGEDGMSGRDGRDGSDGNDGKEGRDGADGLPGRDGYPGRDGEKGREGPADDPGSKGESGQAAGGPIYTRCGRTTCGSNAVLLYEGFIGGSPHDHHGGGGNYHCMVNDAVYNSDNTVTHSGYMAGTEYESNNFGVFSNSAYHQNAPCAVCYDETRSSVIMIPGKRSCYLMSAKHEHNGRRTFECVDAEPEYIDGEHASNDGALFYFNKTSCNQGVPCPPYNANKAIICAVCTK